MKPNFALSLSFEGISLLYRVADGWRVLGEVDLAADDLVAELAAIRSVAESLEGADFRTKLILPNDQIKYLMLETGRGTLNKRKSAANDALESETPYSAAELAIHITPNGRQTHVAAVAKETLSEAESFAVEHKFNPVCFVAIPTEDAYPQEPFFGQTTGADLLLGGQKLDPDTEVIEITGHGLDPESVQGVLADPEEPDPTPLSLPLPESDPEFEVGTAEAAAEPDTTPLANEKSEETQELDVSDAEVGANASENGPEEEASQIPPSAFSSIRARRNGTEPSRAPELGAAAVEEVSGVNAPGVPAAIAASAHSEAQLRFDPAKIIAGLKPDSASKPPKQDEQPDTDSGSFLSRRAARKATAPAPDPAASPSPVSEPTENARKSKPRFKALAKTAAAGSERRNMAIFGVRDGEIGGKPRHLGLILTFVLLLFLAGVALWAALFLDDGIAGLMRRDPVPQIAEMEVESTPVEEPAETPAPLETDALTPVDDQSLTDSAEIEALTDDAVAEALLSEDPLDLTDSASVEAMTDAGLPMVLTENQAEARYAVSGIWERAPQQPATPVAGSTDTLYVTSIDRLLAVRDAVALPNEDAANSDWAMARQATPPPAGTVFDLDDRGLVRATTQGAMSPDGVMVYLGKPANLPKSFPERKPAPGESVTPQMIIKLGKYRPKMRPDDLIEKNERASYGGRTLNELALVRPRLRPKLAKAAAEKDTTPTAAAVVVSSRPRPRPSNFAQIVARATPSDPVAATPVAATVSPKIPSSASVARQATIQNAINLKKINLIGVYGTSSSRRALVRMSNGRYKKVQVGDRIDGGKVAAISDSELRYVKSGKNVVLKLPKG